MQPLHRIAGRVGYRPILLPDFLLVGLSNRFNSVFLHPEEPASERPCRVRVILVHDRGGRVRLGAIEAPDSEWSSPLDVFKATHAHEQKKARISQGFLYPAPGLGLLAQIGRQAT